VPKWSLKPLSILLSKEAQGVQDASYGQGQALLAKNAP